MQHTTSTPEDKAVFRRQQVYKDSSSSITQGRLTREDSSMSIKRGLNKKKNEIITISYREKKKRNENPDLAQPHEDSALSISRTNIIGKFVYKK